MGYGLGPPPPAPKQPKSGDKKGNYLPGFPWEKIIPPGFPWQFPKQDPKNEASPTWPWFSPNKKKKGR